MTTNRSGLDRRDFLKLGAVAAAVPLASSPALAAIGRNTIPLAPGYLLRSDRLSDLREAAASLCALEYAPGTTKAFMDEIGVLEVVPASSLPLGDQELANGTVRFGVEGLYPAIPSLDQQGIYGLDLSVLFPTPPGLDRAPAYYAWALRLENGDNPSPPNRFPVPIGPTGGLRLRFEVLGLPKRILAEMGGSLGPGLVSAGSFETHFTVDWEKGIPRLQRGIYLLPLDQGAWTTTKKLPDPGEIVPMSMCSLIVTVDPVEQTE